MDCFIYSADKVSNELENLSLGDHFLKTGSMHHMVAFQLQLTSGERYNYVNSCVHCVTN